MPTFSISTVGMQHATPSSLPLVEAASPWPGSLLQMCDYRIRKVMEIVIMPVFRQSFPSRDFEWLCSYSYLRGKKT